MSVPTINVLSPTVGPALGRNLVEVTGANFRVPNEPPAGLTNGVRFESVRVTVDGVVAPRVDVIATTSLLVRFPAYQGDGNQATFPAVSVTVENLDDAGDLIAGESVTSASAYIYQRSTLRPTVEDDNPFSAVTRELLQVYKRAVMKDVFISVHTDFSETPFTETMLTRVPSLHLIGPQVGFDADYSTQEFRDVSIGGGLSERYDPPDTYMLEYTVVGVTDSKAEQQALMTAVREVHNRMAYLTVTAPNPPLSGSIEYPMRQTVIPTDTSAPNDSNLLVFTSAIAVRSVWVFFKELRSRLYNVDDVAVVASDMDGGNPEYFILTTGGFDDGFDGGFS